MRFDEGIKASNNNEARTIATPTRANIWFANWLGAATLAFSRDCRHASPVAPITLPHHSELPVICRSPTCLAAKKNETSLTCARERPAGCSITPWLSRAIYPRARDSQVRARAHPNTCACAGTPTPHTVSFAATGCLRLSTLCIYMCVMLCRRFDEILYFHIIIMLSVVILLNFHFAINTAHVNLSADVKAEN